MRVTSSSFTIAEYCGQMETGNIIVNREYQRSDKVWPPAARSYLMETILLGLPIPKLSLYQITDLKTRKTIKEIVDGQQRSQTIFDFLHDKFRMSGKSEHAGKLFSQLEEVQRQAFVDYQLTVDVFVGAAPDEIRQVFRRINSYTVPLNPQEKRHAKFQGDLKWFMVALSEKYTEMLKKIGVFSERQLSRMADAALFSEIVLALSEGIQSASETKIDQFYERNEEGFDPGQQWAKWISDIMDVIFSWEELHQSDLMKPYNFYSLAVAVGHARRPVEKLNELYQRAAPLMIDREIAVANLSKLADALERPEENHRFAEFIRACEKATNRLPQRQARFTWISKALGPAML
jgi:Protein of unknown function DUF262